MTQRTPEQIIADNLPAETKIIADAILIGRDTLSINETAKLALKALAEAGYRVVPLIPTEAQWSGLARDLVMWDRMRPRPTGQLLYQHLDRLGRDTPDWLRKEIPDTDHVPPKGTVAACIYRAMLDVAPGTGG